jgi:guanyl-specific ribonuclease Sa
LTRQNVNQTPQVAQNTNPSVNEMPATNLTAASVAPSNAIQTAQASETNSSQEIFNALTATNLNQWKQAIKDLKQLGGFKYNQDWIMELHKPDGKPTRSVGRPFNFNYNGKTITYDATFINLTTKNGSDNDLLEAELYSPNLNIDQTRELGSQLYEMLGQDPADFLAWCDKVGNHWMDQPLYGTRGNRHLGFKILNTFSDEKPWCIDFIITQP